MLDTHYIPILASEICKCFYFSTMHQACILICVHAHVCEDAHVCWLCAHVCVSMWRPETNSGAILQILSDFLWRQGLLMTWNSLSGCLATEPLGSACVCLPGAGIASVHVLQCVLNVDSGEWNLCHLVCETGKLITGLTLQILVQHLRKEYYPVCSWD